MTPWAELVDTICDLRGVFAPEFRDIAGAVEIARNYRRDLRFPVLMQELTEDTLDTAALEADGLLAAESDLNSRHCPTVMACTLAAHPLVHGDAAGESDLPRYAVESSCRRVAVFLLLEKLRRGQVYETMTLPWDPWDDEGTVVCEGEDPARLAAHLRWLGYAVERGDHDVF